MRMRAERIWEEGVRMLRGIGMLRGGTCECRKGVIATTGESIPEIVEEENKKLGGRMGEYENEGYQILGELG